MHDNLRNLGLEVLDLVNWQHVSATPSRVKDRSAPLTVLAELQRKGLVRHID